jgi:rare lipoprotein A
VVKVKVEVIGKSTVKKKKRTSTGKPEFYQVDSKMVFPKGYGVQIGSFREMVNMMKITQEAKNLVNQKVFIQVSMVNKVKVYRVIVGKSTDKPQQLPYKPLLCLPYLPG